MKEMMEEQKKQKYDPQGGFAIARYMTFRNIVLALGVGAVLIFIGSVSSPRIACLFAALIGLAVLALSEMSTRRRWEARVIAQLGMVNTDYERLVRDVARGRNDMAGLKKMLAAAGTSAKSHGKALPGDAAEQRMVRTIAEQLSRLNDAVPEAAGEQDTYGEEESAHKAELPDDFPSVALAENFSDDEIIALLRTAIREERIDLFLQPIVSLPQRKTRFYEMLSRLRVKDGVHLPAARYIGIAMRRDLLPTIDNLLLLRGLQYIRNTDDGSSARAFFCNITSLTLGDPKFMGDLVEFIAQNRTLARSLVFEFSQHDLATISPESLSVVQGLAQLGCRFSMDQVTALSLDMEALEARRIRFVKAGVGLLLAQMKEPGGLQRLKRLKADFDRYGIDLIVERIETERQVIEVLDLEVDYGQGFLFGRPEEP